jgi:hypothetical protein
MPKQTKSFTINLNPKNYNMKVIICCCSSKTLESFTYNGQTINFVAQVPPFIEGRENYFHPDDFIPNENRTWRDLIEQQEIRNDLVHAYELYSPGIYRSLYEHFGVDLFIYSAGWGIVRADYKLPTYNVTFSNTHNKPNYAIRNNNNNHFNDFNQLLGIEANESIVFMGGLDYVIPFCSLTENLPNEKIIVYKNQNLLANIPNVANNNFQFSHYQTTRRTNWHYEFAQRLINNEIEL